MTILLSTGDRVLYNPIYATGMVNPTGYGCPGTVEDFDKRFVKVRWDNGRSNIYSPKTLSKIIDEREGGTIISIALEEKRVIFNRSSPRPYLPNKANKARLELDEDRVKGVFNL